jgi:uncharacterized membrane protein
MEQNAKPNSHQVLVLKVILFSIAVIFLLLWSFVNFCPIVLEDICMDAGGAWRNGECIK